MSMQIFNTVGRLLLEKIDTISASQRYVLEQMFAKEPYPTKSTKHEIAEELGIGGVKVYNWYRSERAKARLGKCQINQSVGEFVDIYSILVSIKMVVDFNFY